MKSTEMGKDDDTAITVKYNEGGEYQIGPDLLKTFERKGCVSVVKKPSPTNPQNSTQPEDPPKKEESEPASEEKEEQKEEASKVEEPDQVQKKASKNKKKG